jgi:2-succinyl-6-hydroxy-2,4-cyclohexadiene-1-carboxylate synthase
MPLQLNDSTKKCPAYDGVIALHGFLGLPADWDLLRMDGVTTYPINNLSWKNLHDWARQFNVEVKPDASQILMGYSLGGRLALHALLQNPHLWKASILISVHPGLDNPSDLSLRLENDLQWADRFLNEDWDSLIQAWNSREVFSGGQFAFQRKEGDFRRVDLANHLINGSLGSQEDLRESIGLLDMPILWMVGQNDKKFVSIARTLRFKHPLSKVVVVPGVGHRLPWENEILFKKFLESFLESV